MKCIIVDDELLAQNIIKSYIEKTKFLELIRVYSSALDALEILQSEHDIDLLFLDVEMPELTGIDLLTSVKNLPKVIIMSANEKYAIDAFDYDVVDYLLKPFTYVRFIKAVNKASELQKLASNEDMESEFLFIKNNASYIRIRYAEIIWIEALENYIKVFTVSETYTLHLTMKAVEDSLSENLFYRIHRSFIINLKFVSLIENHVILINHLGQKISLPIARSFRNGFYDKINRLK
jgi:DNA-binding LytR/AlgR family response regulator